MPEVHNPHPLKSHRLFDARSSNAVRDILIERYGANKFDVSYRKRRVRGIGSLLHLKEIDIGYLHFSERAQASFPGAGFYRQQFAVTGGGRTRFGAQEFNVDQNFTGVVPFDANAEYEYDKNQSQIIFRVAEKAARHKLAALAGRPVGRNLEFAVSDEFSNPRQLRLRRLIRTFINEIDEDAKLSEFTCAEFSQLLIVTFLVANRHNWSGLLEGEPAKAAPYQVRIIEEYMEANWDKPITIEELAEQTGVGVRNMFATFKKARGYSPMSFLQRVRLNQARDMLQSPTFLTSVLAVSLKCGFNNTGHFAKYYRQAFGELPSVTLAKARPNFDRA